VCVSGECYAKETIKDMDFEGLVIDYYGEFRGGYPWIHQWLIKYAEKLGGYWEWESPGSVTLVL
jgi:hypothetical protein